MHGIIRPSGQADLTMAEGVWPRLVRAIQPWRYLLFLVALPTLIVAAYYYLIASDQYASTADFVIRRADSGVAGGKELGQVFGFNIGTSQSESEAYLVTEFLLSHDAVARLRAEDGLVERFRRQGVDMLSRLWFADPKPETLLKFYSKHVVIKQDRETGITHLSVAAFTPTDARHIARKLLAMGEERINALNERSFRDQVATASRELAEADKALSDIQKRMTGFRRGRNDIDPEGSGRAQIGLVSQLTANLVAARSRLAAMDGLISRSSPQYRALASQVVALERQIAGQSARLAGENRSIASGLGDYEDLVIRREFAAKRYVAAASAYQQARAEALRQQLYLTRVVDANMPVKSLYPERGRIVLTVFFSLLIAYGIGWLLVAGVKEHSV